MVVVVSTQFKEYVCADGVTVVADFVVAAYNLAVNLNACAAPIAAYSSYTTGNAPPQSSTPLALLYTTKVGQASALRAASDGALLKTGCARITNRQRRAERQDARM